MAIKKQLKDKDGNTIYPDVGLNLDDVVYSDDPESTGDDYIDPESYSTTEKKTGGTWIDGKPIYKKTIDFGALPNNTSKFMNTGVSIDLCLKIETIAYNSTSAHSINGLYGSAGNYPWENALLTTNKTQVAITTSSDRSNLSAYVTIYYTKPTN